jgi:thymidylate synthase (FAD)
MKVVEQYHHILYPLDSDWGVECRIIERAGRTAYKSEDKTTDDSHIAFIKNIIARNHLAVIEFGNMVVQFITDRGISHELVRHRLCSFVQESTRYCNYGSGKFDNEVTFIRPTGLDTDGNTLWWWEQCSGAERTYRSLIAGGAKPQAARSVLPNCTKTEIVIKANFREWRHIFQLRAIEKTAHPDMRRLMIPLYQEVRKLCPIVFDIGDPE